MRRNQQLDLLLKNFSELYWLKPVDIVWDAVNAYHIRTFIEDNDVILDLGCGDGLYSLLMFGGKPPVDYDRFLNVKPSLQRINKNQSGDIYSEPVRAKRVSRRPHRMIDFGLELKKHHIAVAESLGIYKKIFESKFEEIPLDNGCIDKVFSVFAFYWGNDLIRQTKEVKRVLRKGGEFIVNLPSEHLYDLHLVKKLAEDKAYSKQFRDVMDRMDGGRRGLASRHARSAEQWRCFFEVLGFDFVDVIPVVNEVMFTLQDISQRPFLPYIFKILKQRGLRTSRNRLKQFLCERLYPDLVNDLLQYECEKGIRHGYYLIRVRKQ